MRAKLYEQTFSSQTNHWWMRNLRKLSFELLKNFGVEAACQHIDIGCGPGRNLDLLDSFKPSRVVGIDLSPIALEMARKACPDADLVRVNASNQLPFADATFDVATVFGVISSEWIESDVAVLREVRRILRTNGILLITEPAFPILYREMDVLGMVKRRYRVKQFTELLRSADFDVMFSNYITSFGAPIILVMKAMKTIKALVGRKPEIIDVPDLRPMHPLLNMTFYCLSRAEALFVRARLPMPFGTTIICVARRK